MPSNITADAKYLRLLGKVLARDIENIKERLDAFLDTQNALGIVYDGSNLNIPLDGEATNMLFAFQQLQATLNTHATNLNKAADFGDSVVT